MAAMKCLSAGGAATSPEESGPSPPSASARLIMSSMQIRRWKEKAKAFSSIALWAKKFWPCHF
eukprot:11552676-Alexandrium_andersonii.AAC.1